MSLLTLAVTTLVHVLVISTAGLQVPRTSSCPDFSPPPPHSYHHSSFDPLTLRSCFCLEIVPPKKPFLICISIIHKNILASLSPICLQRSLHLLCCSTSCGCLFAGVYLFRTEHSARTDSVCPVHHGISDIVDQHLAHGR